MEEKIRKWEVGETAPPWENMNEAAYTVAMEVYPTKQKKKQERKDKKHDEWKKVREAMMRCQ